MMRMQSIAAVGAAVIGTGFIGTVHVETLRRLGVQVRGVLGSTPERGLTRAAALGVPVAYPSLEALLDDPSVDVVHVTTPNDLHLPQSQAALAAGRPVASLLPPGNVKVRFFVAETALGRLQRGQTVTVNCDGCATPVAATIAFIANRAEFTPPVLYSKENRSKLVYLVEARPAPTDALKLHPGQPVDVTLPAP